MRARRHRTGLALFVTSALVVAACGGDDDAGGTTTTTEAVTTTSTTVAPTTTRATTTTAVDTTAAPTTTEAVAEPVMPLTGEPVTDELAAARPAMAVKLDNHPASRPQFGLNAADIVFEENVENLTRFAAVFQSQVPERVGPVRSGRTQDVDILAPFDHPLFVWSGGNANVTRAIAASELVSLSPTTTQNRGFFREQRGGEDREHTLYARPTELYPAFTMLYAPAPKQQFAYRAEGDEPGGSEADGVEVAMDGVRVRWTWDEASGTYLREQNGSAHMDATLGQVSAANVVVLEVAYRPSPADARSPEAQTLGSGSAWVLTAGRMITGTWARDDRAQPFTLTADDGSVIELTPGRTWVELPRTGRTTPL